MAGIGLLIGVIALLGSSLVLVADKTNELDARRSHESIQSALDASHDKMTALLSDNSVWDDAAARLYKSRPDTNWLYTTWGAVSDDAHPYDGTFLIDENRRIIWGYFRGALYQGHDLTLFGSGFNAMFRARESALAKGAYPIAGLTRTPYGVAVVSVGLITPSSGDISHQGASKRYLVMTRHLTAAMLGDLSRTFRVDGLTLVADGSKTVPGFTSMALRGADGRGIGRLVWKLRRPGADAARVVRPQIEKIMWLIGAMILFFVALAGYGLLKLARSENAARTTALTDGLSGLPNRRALIEHLHKQTHLQAFKRESRCVVFMDLDGFKDINDIYGHDVGDKLIVILADALRTRLPKGAMLARMGGDEFALLVNGRDCRRKGRLFAEAALDLLKTPMIVAGRTIQVGASIGIAWANSGQHASQELFRRADMAMYESKTHGKNRITPYDPSLDSVRLQNQAIESGIRSGLARDEFEIYYQPIVDAQTRSIGAVEALVRWPRRPEGPLCPDDFIPIAETSGLIQPLGLFVLRRACADLLNVSGLTLSVNVSPAQFRDPDFEASIAAVIAEAGFPVSRLELEVTEGYLIENPERAVSAIAALKAMGISISLDDFGTGYSSIGYLRRYGFDNIKIDKSLASLVDTDPQAAALVAGTVAIASALHISVTAEGVESDEHAQLLRLAGCHKLQGYLFSRPMPLADILRLVAAHECASPEKTPLRNAAV